MKTQIQKKKYGYQSNRNNNAGTPILGSIGDIGEGSITRS